MNHLMTKGQNGSTIVYSGEVPIVHLLKFFSRSNYTGEAGLNIEAQEGINRAWDADRSKRIAKNFEKALNEGRPIENGAALLVDVNSVVEAEEEQKNIYQVRVNGKVPCIDRQHTVGAFEFASNNEEKFPLLSKYIKDKSNTITVRIILGDRTEARRRFMGINTDQKAPSPVERMSFMALDALECEKQGRLIENYSDDLPTVVSFMAWQKMAKEKGHPFYKRVVVDSDAPRNLNMKVAPPTARKLVDQTIPIYVLIADMMPEIKDMPLEEQATVLKNVVTPYWESLREQLPEAFGEKWYNYQVQRNLGVVMHLIVLASLIRMFRDRRKKQRSDGYHSMSVDEFAQLGVPDFVEKSGGATPFKDIECWRCGGGGSGSGALSQKAKAEGIESALDYTWRGLNIYGWHNWKDYLRSPQTHSSKRS